MQNLSLTAWFFYMVDHMIIIIIIDYMVMISYYQLNSQII